MRRILAGIGIGILLASIIGGVALATTSTDQKQNERLTKLEAQVKTTNERVSQLVTRVNALETHDNGQDPKIAALESTVSTLQAEVAELGKGSGGGEPPAEEPPVEEPPVEPPPVEEPAPSCTQTVTGSVASAIQNAPANAVLCLKGASVGSVNLSQVAKSNVTLAGPGTLGYTFMQKVSGLRFTGIHFTGGFDLIGNSGDVKFLGNQFTGNFGIHGVGEDHTVPGSKVANILIEGNTFTHLDYTGSQQGADGYGIEMIDGVENVTIRGNTIKEPASDYIQFASPAGQTVITGNTFLGPSLLGTHQDHQDLVQIFGGQTGSLVFSNNVARHTETQESLLFQEGLFHNVTIEDNLFDHDSRGYTCQLYQSAGLVFRRNTVVGSHWGCLFRDSGGTAGSGYQIDHNIFVGTEENSDISTEGRAGSFGTYDFNVSGDGSASGANSVRNWKPSWVDTTNYQPVGLPFAAGYRP